MENYDPDNTRRSHSNNESILSDNHKDYRTQTNVIVQKKDAEHAIMKMMKGFTLDLASKYPNTIRGTLDNIQFTPGGAKLNEIAFGRYLYEAITQALKLGGDVLEKIVLSNFDVNTFAQERQRRRSEKDIEVKAIERKLIITGEPDKPDKEFIQYSIHQDTKQQHIDLYNRYVKRHEATLQQQQQQTPTTTTTNNQAQSPPSSTRQGDAGQRRTKGRSTRSSTQQQNKQTTTQMMDAIQQILHNPTINTTPNSSASQAKQNQPNQTIEFKDSTLYTEYLEQHKLLEADILDQINTEYFTVLNQYREQKHQHAQLKLQLEQIKTELQDEVILELITAGIQAAINLLLGKVSNAIAAYPIMRGKLQGRIQIPTGEYIHDPVTIGNLCGLYYGLYKEYNKATMGVFCTQLMDLLNLSMNESISKDQPDIAISECNKHLKAWKQLDLYSFMDIDKLFTIALLNSFYKDSDVRKQATTEVLKYIEQRYIIGDESLYEDDKNMPIYTYLTHYINNVYLKCRAMVKDGNNLRQSKQVTTSSQPVPYRTNNHNKGLEMAASADTEAYATSVGGKDAQGPYEKEISRDDNLWFTDTSTGTRYLYLATTNPCPKCSDRTAKSKCPRPLCFVGKCKRCNLYGHKATSCRQKVMNPNPHMKTNSSVV
jgi:hypothetical protein